MDKIEKLAKLARKRINNTHTLLSGTHAVYSSGYKDGFQAGEYHALKLFKRSKYKWKPVDSKKLRKHHRSAAEMAIDYERFKNLKKKD